MSLATVVETIDWLKRHGCKVFAAISGEPLIHPSIVEILAYAHGLGMFTYVPTNLLHMDEEFLRRLLTAGLNLLDVAVDVIKQTPGLDKNLDHIRKHLDLVLAARHEQGLILKLNTVITRFNIKDVLDLADFARERRIPISFHLVQKTVEGDPRYPWVNPDVLFSQKDAGELERLCSTLIDRKRAGWPINNPEWYFHRAVEQVRDGKCSEWDCKAGRSTVFVQDGKLWPCMVLNGEQASPWGTVGNTEFPFDPAKLEAQIHGPTGCSHGCLSCVNTLTASGLLNTVLPYIKS